MPIRGKPNNYNSACAEIVAYCKGMRHLQKGAITTDVGSSVGLVAVADCTSARATMAARLAVKGAPRKRPRICTDTFNIDAAEELFVAALTSTRIPQDLVCRYYHKPRGQAYDFIALPKLMIGSPRRVTRGKLG